MRIGDSEKPHSSRDGVKGVLAAVISAQSTKNQAHDFGSGSPRRFTIAGTVATLTFVALTYFAVQAVLKAAGRKNRRITS